METGVRSMRSMKSFWSIAVLRRTHWRVALLLLTGLDSRSGLLQASPGCLGYPKGFEAHIFCHLRAATRPTPRRGGNRHNPRELDIRQRTATPVPCLSPRARCSGTALCTLHVHVLYS